MQTLQTILLYGHDELLLMTRGRILECAGFRVGITSELKEISRLVRELRTDLVILCHSLSRTECATAGLIAKHHRAALLMLLMADGSAGERDCGMSEVADDVFNLSLEPEKLVAKVRSMLAGRPRRGPMSFPEAELHWQSPLARTN